MAAGDVIVTADVLVGHIRFMAGTVQLDGTNPTPVQLSPYGTTVLAGQATISGSVAPGVDNNDVTALVNGTSLDIYMWKITTGGASGNPTTVASSDNARLVNWFAILLANMAKAR